MQTTVHSEGKRQDTKRAGRCVEVGRAVRVTEFPCGRVGGRVMGSKGEAPLSVNGNCLHPVG
jgi:hypothetical protein